MRTKPVQESANGSRNSHLASPVADSHLFAFAGCLFVGCFFLTLRLKGSSYCFDTDPTITARKVVLVIFRKPFSLLSHCQPLPFRPKAAPPGYRPLRIGAAQYLESARQRAAISSEIPKSDGPASVVQGSAIGCS